MLWIVLWIGALSVGADDDSSCYSACEPSSIPVCGTWMVEEPNASGTYQLGEGVLNMSCVVNSLPRPSSIAWLHRPTGGSSWTEFACSTKEERKECSVSGEQRVFSRCVLRLVNLTQSGHYRCEATTNGDSRKTTATSSEVAVDVVGIQGVTVLERYLTPNRAGYVEIEVCANPKPEVWWVVGEGLVLPHSGNTRVASSNLIPRMHRMASEAPATQIPFCHQIRLLLHTVHKKEDLGVVVRSQWTTRTFAISTASLPFLWLSASLLLFC